MGHVRLGRLPTTKRWVAVVDLLKAGGDVAALADATAHAAESELETARGDPALKYTVWLLAQLPLAANTDHFGERLVELGFDRGADQSPLALVSAFGEAVDRHVAGQAGRTDFGVLARSAAAESLSALIDDGASSLFGTSPNDFKDKLATLATKRRFALLARDFFARLTLKTLEYYLSRALPDQVGPGRRLPSFDSQIAFRQSLERHCREASLIVEDFAGGWFSKNNYQGTLTEAATQGFTDYALKKMRDELRTRRASNG